MNRVYVRLVHSAVDRVQTFVLRMIHVFFKTNWCRCFVTMSGRRNQVCDEKKIKKACLGNPRGDKKSDISVKGLEDKKPGMSAKWQFLEVGGR
jgi:hypothetical protein